MFCNCFSLTRVHGLIFLPKNIVLAKAIIHFQIHFFKIFIFIPFSCKNLLQALLQALSKSFTSCVFKINSSIFFDKVFARKYFLANPRLVTWSILILDLNLSIELNRVNEKDPFKSEILDIPISTVQNQH